MEESRHPCELCSEHTNYMYKHMGDTVLCVQCARAVMYKIDSLTSDGDAQMQYINRMNRDWHYE